MKRFAAVSLLLFLLLSACSLAPQAATATPMPSNTLEPTSTPLPTETPSPVPTSTPDKTATALSAATERADAVMGELHELLGESDVAYEDGHLAWRQTKQMQVSLHGPGWDYVEVDQNLTAGNFILKSDITWEADGIILCGMVFRSEPDIEKGKQYRFMYLRLSGLPAWEVDVFEFGRLQNSPSRMQTSYAIDQDNAATNQVVLIAQDEQFTLYINGEDQNPVFDQSKQRTDGNFAFFGMQDSGNGYCQFENSWIWALE